MKTPPLASQVSQAVAVLFLAIPPGMFAPSHAPGLDSGGFRWSTGAPVLDVGPGAAAGDPHVSVKWMPGLHSGPSGLGR